MNVTCTSCGKVHEAAVPTLINVGREPELKASVRDGSLFVSSCPYCGAPCLIRTEAVYHDPAERLLIWLLPGGEMDPERFSALSQALSGEMDHYITRRVGEVGELIEKVGIFDAGLDDITIEMCKFVTRQELAQARKDEALLTAPIKFFRLESADNDMVFSYFLGGEAFTFRVGFNVYEDCRAILSRNPSILPSAPFPRIDSDWINSIMK